MIRLWSRAKELEEKMNEELEERMNEELEYFDEIPDGPMPTPTAIRLASLEEERDSVQARIMEYDRLVQRAVELIEQTKEKIKEQERFLEGIDAFIRIIDPGAPAAAGTSAAAGTGLRNLSPSPPAMPPADFSALAESIARATESEIARKSRKPKNCTRLTK